MLKTKIKNFFIDHNSKTINALKKINRLGGQSLIVVSNKKVLRGILSGADIRKAIMNHNITNDKINKIYGFCNVCGLEATKTYRKIEGGDRTHVGAANIYEPRCLKHWNPQ